MGLMLPIVMMMGMSNPKMLMWFMGIYIILGVVGTLVALMVDKRKAKKAAQFSDEVEGNAAAQGAQKGVEDQQRMDDLRQEFQRGLEIYSQYGKDLYSLPWYVVVGEAGSGKTEMIRRSEIGFPDKLQKFWQGSGGTVSMHWWFTNHAVIIDTAGRLFLKDSDAGGGDDGSEKLWKEFLQMLTKNRQDCPINGLCLVIPASSLVAREEASAEQASYRNIDEKAGQISRQMEVLRSELGVRFPVYVVVTKTDLVVGFREFFDSIEKPEERFQMLGWSNPAPLNQPVRAKLVGDHLKNVAERLRKRRMALMKEPNPKSRMKTQLDNVDSMFELPRSLEAMAPKLERYLQQIFGQDQWSGEPPFLRGVYFTSSLQQGGVLDGAMAAALGIDVEEFQKQGHDEDLSLSKNKTFFLRDLFVDKIFHEKGLVVRRGKKTSNLKGWKFWLPLSFLLALILVLGLGLLTGVSKPAELKRWEALDDDYYSSQTQGFVGVIDNKTGNWKWAEDKEAMLDTLEGLGASDLAGAPKMGWLFGLASRMDGGIKEDRKAAYKVAVDGMILRPLVEATVEQLNESLLAREDNEIRRVEERALLALIGLYDAEDHEEMDKQLAACYSLIRLPLPKGKKGRAKTLTVPIFESVKAAYPDGVKFKDVMTEMDQEVLVGILNGVFSVGGDRGLLRELRNFDERWLALADTEEAKLGSQLTELQAISSKLNGFRNRMKQLGNGEDAEQDQDDTADSIAAILLDEYRPSLEALAPKRIDRWEDSLSGEGLSDQDLTDTKDLVVKYNVHSELVNLAQGLFKFDFDGMARPFDPTVLSQVKTFKRLVAEAMTSVKRYTSEETVNRNLLTSGCRRFLKTTFVEKASFPLVNPNNREGRRSLTEKEAGAMTIMVKFLNETLGDDSPRELINVYNVGMSLFDEEALAEGRISSKKWTVQASTDDSSFSAKVYLQVHNDEGLVSSHSIVPTSGDGLAKGDPVVLPVNARLVMQSEDSTGEKYPFIKNDEQRDWEMVWWFVNDETLAGDNKYGVNLNNEGDGKQSVQVWVNKPKLWPASLILLEDFNKIE